MQLIVGTADCSIRDVVEALHETQTFSEFHRNYLTVAVALDIRPEDIQFLRKDLEINNVPLKYTVFSLMHYWVSKFGRDAKLTTFIKELKSNNMRQCAESLETRFCINQENIEEEDTQEVPNGLYCRPLQRCFKSRGISCAERDILLNLIIQGVRHETLLQKDPNGLTFIHYLLRPGTDLTLDRFNQLVQCLIDQGSATVFNIQGWRYNSTPLQWLMCSLKLEANTLLNLEGQGVNFEVMDEFKDSTLAYAIDGKQSVEILIKLMSCGATWEYKNLKGDSLLHHAVRCGYREAIELFVKAGLDLNEKNDDGETPLHRVF